MQIRQKSYELLFVRLASDLGNDVLLVHYEHAGLLERVRPDAPVADSVLHNAHGD